MKYGLKEKTIEQIQAVFSKYPNVEKAVLYGSRAKGNYKNGSDIDLTLHGKDLTLKIQHKIASELDDLLLPYKIDLSIFDQISNPEFVDHIQRVGVVFYQKKRQSNRGSNKEGWNVEKLGEVCEVFADGDWIESKDQSPEGVRLIQTGNVGIGIFKDRGEKARYISEATFKRLRCTEIFEGDCLVSRLPDPVGRACILPDTGEKMITAVDCTIIRFDKKKVIAEFFNYYSQSDQYLNDVDHETSGTTRKRISRSKLAEVEIPIPPIPEQQRIVSVLDEAFASIAQAKSHTERNLVNARELYKSLMHEVFENKDWEEKKFGDVCGFVRGPFGGSLKKEIFVKDGYAVYEQQHAIYNQFEEIRYFVNKSKFNEMQRFEINPGNLIMSCSGTMGKVAIVPEVVKQGIINQALLLLKPNKHLLNTFIKYWMESENFQESLRAFSQGAAIQNVASVKILKEISVPLPPLAEQRAVVGRLEALSVETKRLEEIYQSKVESLDELRRVLLGKAFEGLL